MAKTIKTNIREQYLYGYKFTRGNRYVEVLRVDSCCGHWDSFCYVDSKQTRGTPIGNRSKSECISDAKKWLKS